MQPMFPLASYTVSVGASSTPSSTPVVFGRQVMRVVSTVDCFVQFGPSAVATTTTSIFLKAGVPEYFRVTSGSVVAVIQLSAGGTLYVTELSV